MNEMLFRTLLKRYEAVIEDSLYKIQSFNENNIIIPEHIDITGEVDKLLLIIAEAEDKVAIMRKYYVRNKADKQVIWQCICMGKKIKKKIKTTLEKVSNLSLRLKMLVYIANVCQIVVLKSVMWQIIMSPHTILQFAYARAIQNSGKTDFFTIHIQKWNPKINLEE